MSIPLFAPAHIETIDKDTANLRLSDGQHLRLHTQHLPKGVAAGDPVQLVCIKKHPSLTEDAELGQVVLTELLRGQ